MHLEGLSKEGGYDLINVNGPEHNTALVMLYVLEACHMWKVASVTCNK